MRIARFQHIVVFTHLALVSVVVVVAWTYVLNPDAKAIQSVSHVMSSPDGSTAWATTTVDRGDPTQHRPIFSMDLASGQVAHLKSDPDQGPWTSADGQTTVWSAASPIFFRPIRALFGASTPFRIRGAGGEVQPLAIPARLGPGFRGRGRTDFVSGIYSVLPSPGGQVLAALGGRLTLISRTGEDRGDVDFGKDKHIIHGLAFAPGGALRVALGRTQAAPPSVEFADVDPQTLKVTSLGSFPAAFARVQFNRTGTKALVTISGDRFKSVSVSLVDLETRPLPAPQVLVPGGPPASAIFLADGRIVTLAGARDQAVLRVFTAAGEPALELPMGEGHAMLSGEMFPGAVAVHTGKYAPMDLTLIDCATGAVVRRVSGMTSPLMEHQFPRRSPAPLPGTAGAGLLISQGKLFELASPTAEPRLLLPLP